MSTVSRRFAALLQRLCSERIPRPLGDFALRAYERCDRFRRAHTFISYTTVVTADHGTVIPWLMSIAIDACTAVSSRLGRYAF